MSLSVVSIELERHGWSDYRCGCGSNAGHVADTFRKLLSAHVPSDVSSYGLDGHLEVQAMVFEVAVPATSVIMAALMEELPPFVRGHLMVTLLRLVSGESHASEIAAGRVNLQEECIAVVQDGMWLLYREAAVGDVENAIDILEFVESDERKFDYYRSRTRSRMKKQ